MRRWLWLVAWFACGCESCWGVTPHDLHWVGSGGEGTCTFDADCPEEFACEQTVCVPVCATDSNCESGDVCAEGINTELLVCRHPPTLAGDAGSDADSAD